MLRNSENEWGAIAKSLHWLLAALIIGQLVLGRIAENAPVSPRKFDLFIWHKSIGVTILLLVLLRLVWRAANRPPVPAAGVAVRERQLAQAGHALLYCLMVLVPLTGWWVSDTSRIPFKLYRIVPLPDFMAPDRDASELAGNVHTALTTALLVVIIMHVLAALRHHFVLRNGTLVRMLPMRRRRDG